METIKMLFFFLLTFISSGKGVPRVHLHQNAHHEHNGPSKCDTKPQLNTVDNANCACFKKGGTNVADVLGLKTPGDRLQRQVIYLYKDPATNTLQYYSPRKEKQALFPDLALEQGDRISYDFGIQPLELAFDPNYAVDLKKTQNEGPVIEKKINLVPTLTPINAAITEDILPEEITNLVPTIVPMITAYTKDVNVVSDSPNIADLVEQVPLIHSSLDGFITDAFDTSPYYPKKQTHGVQPVYSNGHQNPVSTNKNENTILDPSNSVENNVVNQESTGIPPYLKDHEGFNVVKLPLRNFKQYPLLEQDNIQPLLTPHVTNLQVPHISPKLQDDGVLVSQPTENKNLKNLLDQMTNPETGSGSVSLLPTVGVHDYAIVKDVSDVNKEPTHSDQIITVPGVRYKYLTFDKWFDDQMQRVQDTRQLPIKNIELSSLKDLIEKTLSENGLFVTPDGVLTDSKGKALDVTNLKLRPILIGDSVAYDSLLALKDGKYELPANLPYLEAILVTLVNPPKVLGVIPLGKTFVPRRSFRPDHDEWARKAQNSMRSCHSRQCILENLRLQNYYETDGHKTSLLTSRIQPKVQAVLGAHKQVKKMKEKTNVHAQNRILIGRQRPKNYNQILEAVRTILDEDRDLAKTGQPGSGGRGTERPEEREEDLPGFRIIGGFPATSSGTPLNSKGRSGYPYY